MRLFYRGKWVIPKKLSRSGFGSTFCHQKVVRKSNALLQVTTCEVVIPKGGKERDILDTIKDSHVGRCPPQSDDY